MAKNNEEMLANFRNAKIECEEPNASIYTFQGILKMKNNKEISLEADNLCLRGSSLRNCEWIIGIAVFTGHDTKVMMNSARSKPKFSKIEKITQKYIAVSLLIQCALCLAFALATSIWNKARISGGVNCDQLVGVDTELPMSFRAAGAPGDRKLTPCYFGNERENIHAYWYLGLDLENTAEKFDLYGQNTFVQTIVLFFTWYLIMMNFVSISLLVSLELAKFFQGVFMQQDYMMYDEEKDMSAKVQSSNLNEELGMVSYIFSDKTGTLT